jgi:hypothetical protein
MEITLQQAIEIHAKALRAHRGHLAPRFARHRAKQLAASGDHEGHEVWQRVAAVAETLPDWTPPEEETSHAA